VRLRSVFAVALVLRIAAACVHALQGPVIQPDEANYLLLARAIAEEHRYATYPGGPPEVIRGPAYAAFLVPFVLLGGTPVLGPALVQALLGTLTAWMAAAALRRRLVRHGVPAEGADRAATLAAWACALSPVAIAWERLVMSEAIATLLLTAALTAWWEVPHARRPALAACAAGLCLGALVLAKPAFLLLPLALALPAFFRRQPARIAHAALVAVTAAAVVAPWTVRNLELTGRPVPVGLGSGLFLYAATLPRAADGVPVFEHEADRASMARYLNHDTSVADRVAADDAFRRRAIVRIREHPFAYAASFVPRAVRLWISSHSESLSKRLPPRVVRLALAAGLGLVVLAALSVLLLPAGPWRRSGLALLAVPVYTTVVHAGLAAGSRYAVVAWPFVWCAAAVALSARRRAGAIA
jgi:4-amino-4-deoxy-L-arabinose transferase-like glycosyltransferase